MKAVSSLPCMIVKDEQETINWYKRLGFDSVTVNKKDHVFILTLNSELFLMGMPKKEAEQWLPMLRNQKLGASGWFYLSVPDQTEVINNILKANVEVIKDSTSESTGRLFYFRDLNGYIIGINDINTI